MVVACCKLAIIAVYCLISYYKLFMQVNKLIIYNSYLSATNYRGQGKSDSLVINNKINGERGIFEPNMDIKGSISVTRRTLHLISTK